MKNKLNLILILLSNLLVYSQNLPKIIQPSPEAANLSRYADIPVSLYTGKPQIDFPLHTLECGNLKLPISLSYYASGVKVEDYSTWAGIGWALNAGGVISRVVANNGTYLSSLSNNLPISGTVEEQYGKFLNLVEHPENSHFIYHYNFLQYSGSFQGNTFRKHTNLKFEFSTDYNSIIITDDNGIKYYFECKNSLYDIQTDYYLTKIESADKYNIINFEYIRGDLYYQNPHISKFYILTSNGAGYIKDSEGVYGHKDSGVLLSRIYTSNNDSVEFIKKDIYQFGGPNSLDKYRKALDSIIVYHDNNKSSSFHFKTNNIQTTKIYSPYPDQPAFLYNENKGMDYRLYLDGFEKIDVVGNIIESHSFEYYGRTVDGKDLLPNRFSRAQDLGGFYNGQDSNTSLIPPLNETLMPDGSGLSDSNLNNNGFVSPVNIAGANRNPNLEYMQMGTLKSIKYPTGGFAKFYYSQMENPLTLEPFWGIKIDKIEYLDSDESLLKRKNYVYQNPVLGYPIPSFWHYTLNRDYNDMTPFPLICQASSSYMDCMVYNSTNSYNWAIKLSPDPVNDQGLDQGPMIGYGLVKEFEEGNGRIDYQFSTDGAYDEEAKDHYFEISQFYDGFPRENLFMKNSWPLGPIMDNNWKMGTLLNKATYKEDGTKKQDIRYHYSYDILKTIPGINIYSIPKYTSNGGYVAHNSFYYYYFAYLSVWERLDSVTETIDNVTKVTNYTYDERKQVSQISTTKSNGDSFTTNFKYPYNYTSPVFNNMVSRNIIAPVIEKTEKINNNQVKLLKTNYSFWDTDANNLNLISSSNLTDCIYPLSVEVKKGEDPIETRLNYNSYDSKGNIASVSKTNDLEIIYIWGYKQTQPVAKIENATQAQITALSLNMTLINDSSTTDSAMQTELQKLRTGLPHAMVTTYTYKPLIGISTITDPKGDTVTYNYDAFGRLQNVKDKDGNILSENEYHYKN
ncbi:RHS repeat domain-containing protein [Flavobacterium eburneipallidum]|uniref:RHS repeat domain-containing protein n=1 Tax=Flavobacterium eburneipallidum TaxID=3003263 RepID=UPI002482EB0F|nr:RHS repeat domain-containing protein [Flavobacterium eburneipallidum]